ncbi:DUF6320 domain-containing protein [Paenibacillus pseudetheri]|uniref:Zinc ribbon domain-containing protein n=1 Tax=Paenibacillus pseudetheri TaxID=2897682 RepID=A0ABM9BNL8_9BACL|nr:DUF6320 domain-containing protein [Paenibacillus pseudetheri]CAH1059717.1 hypothetical protein PAECIP111894_05929 [Paenibacillus pseudetheri]
MTKCIRCNVTVDNQHNRCPLCSKPLKIRGESTTEYPSYKEVYQETKSFTVAKLFLFLAISAIVLSITINALTYHINPRIWSIIVSTGLIYAWIVVKDTILSNKHIGRKILYHYVMLSIFLLVIDIFVGFRGWSTNYAIPLFGVAATFIMTMLAIVQKSLWRHDIGYILAMFFINLCPMLLFVFNLSHVIWTSVFSIVYSLLTIIGMIIFSDRKFISEIRRRFHY